MRNLIKFFLLIFICLSCVSKKEGRHLKERVFAMQKRLLSLESNLSKTGQQNQNDSFKSQRNIASTSVRLAKQESEIQRVYGQLEALKIGVETGKMPGIAVDDSSVASRLAKLEERM